VSFAATQPLAAQTTSPPTGDTAGYWQQHVAYRIIARLDEATATVHARGTLVYTNHSPDTLRALFFHQYLNAFRPHSAWTAVDQKEGRVRFQNLREPNYGYERFTATPTVNGTPVTPQYPGAPDSTVARFALPRPLAPGDSCTVTLQWDARPSTVLRRQGRRGRSYDFAQWYPKIAVYDRKGWEAHALTPAGELYGEFGSYDVTLVLRNDQIVAATGVVVAGDPGWAGVSRTPGYPRTKAAPGEPEEPGWRAVRFYGDNIHHFAWSTSPDYRYEGGDYITHADTIAVHVLYRRGDEATWGRGIAVRRTKQALAWLESVYGIYKYPQLVNVHRLESGGTEFPMMIMDGSASQGLILHEAGHMYTYAMLANNEWASAWMDEGLTEYQTEWAERLTRADRHRPATGVQIAIAREGIAPPPKRGYRALAVTPLPGEQEDIVLDRLDLLHRDQPIGLRADQFREFGLYNAMVYERAVRMYGALRDILGESAWRNFLHQYYARWAFKHVDELAMRTEAERAAGRSLDWFFDQWLRHTGLVEYALAGWSTAPEGPGAGWTSTVIVARRGPYLHPIPVGVRTADGWSFGQSEPLRDPDTVRVHSRLRPLEVRLDPGHLTEDWWRFDDANITIPWFDDRTARVTMDWPLLDQWREERLVAAILPYAWYSDPGHFTPAIRLRLNYQGWLDRLTLGLAVPTGPDVPVRSHVQGWFTLSDPAVGAKVSPGISIGEWALDGVNKFEFGRTWNESPFVYANGPQRVVSVAVTSTVPYDATFLDATRWERVTVTSISGTGTLRAPLPDTARLRAFLDAGFVSGSNSGTRGYLRADVAATQVWATAGGAQAFAVRGYAGYDPRAPIERAVFLSSEDATETFADDFLRPRGAPLERSDVHFVALDGAGLRGYDPRLAVPNVLAVNAEATTRLVALGRSPRALAAYVGAFGDAGTTFGSGPMETPALAAIEPVAVGHDLASHVLADAGVGMALRGYVYDQDVALRVDIPFLVAQPLLAAGRSAGGPNVAAWRWTFSFNDLW
jgi:hypothetical protein